MFTWRSDFGLLLWLIDRLTIDLELRPSAWLPYPLIWSVIFWLSTGLFFGGMIFGLFGGLRASTLDSKAVPNLGIRLSMRNAAFAGGLGVLVFVLVFATGLWLISGESDFLILGPIVGPFPFLWYGVQEAIQHYILRFILYWLGYTPLCYANFLDHAARLVFLQKVGGGYIFIHRLLLEHFAEMRKDEKETALTAVTLRSAEYQESRQSSA